MTHLKKIFLSLFLIVVLIALCGSLYWEGILQQDLMASYKDFSIQNTLSLFLTIALLCIAFKIIESYQNLTIEKIALFIFQVCIPLISTCFVGFMLIVKPKITIGIALNGIVLSICLAVLIAIHFMYKDPLPTNGWFKWLKKGIFRTWKTN